MVRIFLIIAGLVLIAPLPGQTSKPTSKPTTRPTSKPKSDPEKLWALAMEKFQQAKRSSKPKVREQLYLDTIALFRQITKRHKESRFFGIAQYNIGVILSSNMKGRDREAIREFEKLIKSDVNDKDKTGYLMTPFRNYRYFAWGRIATCQQRLGHPGKALAALYSMRKAFVSHCGTCMRDMEKGFERRAKATCVDLLGDKAATDAVDAAWASHRDDGAKALLLELSRRLRNDHPKLADRVAAVLKRDLGEQPASRKQR